MVPAGFLLFDRVQEVKEAEIKDTPSAVPEGAPGLWSDRA